MKKRQHRVGEWTWRDSVHGAWQDTLDFVCESWAECLVYMISIVLIVVGLGHILLTPDHTGEKCDISYMPITSYDYTLKMVITNYVPVYSNCKENKQ